MIPNKNIVLIGNPVAGRGAVDRIEKAVRIVKAGGFDIHLMLTGKKGDAELFSREIAGRQSQNPNTQPPPLIIAAGGDGTYNEVINGIAGTNIRMAILPLGTTNVLAKELDIPESVDGAVRAALSGKTRTVCLGKIFFKAHDSNSGQSRYFLLMAGIGYDGEAVFNVNKEVKKYSGKASYIWSGINTLLSWNPDKLTVNAGNKTFEGFSLIICNASKYAGHFKVAPDARLDEPYLHACIMHGRRRVDIVRYALGILTKKHQGFKDITLVKAKKFEIKGNAHIQIDGDYLGRTPAEIEIVPDALRIVS